MIDVSYFSSKYIYRRKRMNIQIGYANIQFVYPSPLQNYKVLKFVYIVLTLHNP